MPTRSSTEKQPGGILAPNARCEIKLTCLIIRDAMGVKNETGFGYSCVADTRAFGKFSSMESLLFT